MRKYVSIVMVSGKASASLALGLGVVALACGCALSEAAGQRGVDHFVDAVRSANVQAVRECLVRRLDPNARSTSGASPFVAAMDQLEGSFSCRLRPITAEEAALIRDLWERRRTIAVLLAESGGDVQAECMHGEPPLIVAIHNGEYELARLLIEHGAEGNVRLSRRGWEYRWALHRAISQPALVELLVAAGADVNALDKLGYPALVFAALNGLDETVRILLRNGADVDAQDEDGDCALMAAVSQGHLNTVRILLDAGATANVRRITRAHRSKDGELIFAEYLTVMESAERGRRNGGPRELLMRYDEIISLLKASGVTTEGNHSGTIEAIR